MISGRLLFLVLGLMGTVPSSLLLAQTAEELKQRIEVQSSTIEQIEKEILQFEKQLDAVGKEKQTLQGAVNIIDLSRKKITSQITVEQSKIVRTEQKISELEASIATATASIERGVAGLASLFRQVNEQEDQSLVELLLGSDSASQAWTTIDSALKAREAIQARVQSLQKDKRSTEEVRTKESEQKKILLGQKKDFETQKRALEVTRSETKKLLSDTNSRESEYQKILAAKKAAKVEFEAQMNALESQLAFTLDPTRLPSAGSGVLSWPLDQVKVTQKFGNTAFAKSGAYAGKGHNGIDLRASIGTPIKSALDGKIIGVGNTDVYKGCYSYGKWVLIKHENGLSTLYAHLSDIQVGEGQKVNAREIIGYSGNTGYSTGPHLHFTVYASEAVQLKRLGDAKSKTNCADAVIPIAPLNAYLDPLEYL
ncbi:MAG: peptidoglycan DD-metalloendopeptidase family protein [Patescibacteria group bacterium]